ncbi:MAG: aminotransferase class V-fold PLP-dependent enzyme [Acidobacteria bacterium]|nr:MAG: aminotransferase class V-fold PLP-dependent enzyme [Acidobacteriota bacterium]
MNELKPPIDPAAFDLPPDVLWVMCCSDGPVPRTAARAVAEFLPRETQPWTLRWQADFQGVPRATREAAARLLGADAADLTLTPTTSSGLVTIAQGYPWRAGDEVVVPRGEFPSNVWPWKALARRGVRLWEVELWDGQGAGTSAWTGVPPAAGVDPETRLLDAIGPATRMLALSWVRFQDGLVLDLRRLAAGCAERGVELVVDGIQGAGTLPLAVAELDGLAAFASGGHKGLLAPQGLGLLWTHPGLRRMLLPAGSWLSVEQATDFSRPSTDFDRAWVADGTRLEPGVPNLLGAVALKASLELLERAGVGAIAEHVRRLSEIFLDGLARLPDWAAEAGRLRGLLEAGRLGPILALHHRGRGPQHLDRLLRRGYAGGVYASVREGYLRIAFHGWHDAEDVERLLAWLAAPGEEAVEPAPAGAELVF